MRAFVLASVIPLLALGCDPPSDTTVDQEFQRIVRNRAAIEFPCGWEHVAVAPLEGFAYRAEGCGTVQIYECGFETGTFSDDRDKTIYVCHAESSKPATGDAPPPSCAHDGG